MTTAPSESSKIAAAVRNASFAVRRRGLDEDEVRAYLFELADTIERQEQEIATMRAELGAGGSGHMEISDQAVIMFSEAQKVSDSLIDEAVMHARDLMASARTQQREIVREAQQSGASAAGSAANLPGAAGSPAAADYDHPVPEIEYVRTFAKVAQVQLRSVLDALTEQVDNLGEVPRLDETQQRPPSDGPSS